MPRGRQHPPGKPGTGLTFSDATSGYLGNILQGNSGNTVGNTGQVSGGTSLNQNVCNGTDLLDRGAAGDVFG